MYRFSSRAQKRLLASSQEEACKMHILITNDDGPPDDKSCPYIKYFVDEVLRSTDWKVLIVVPDRQRSWIGKAHFAGKTLSASFIYTKDSTASERTGRNKFLGPFDQPDQKIEAEGYQRWCLIDSTPAACADIGIYHQRNHDTPIDLVISGPNFGRNAGNLYMLSSGTVGAAFEAVTHGVKAIALSYEFRSHQHDYNQIREASSISVKLIGFLAQQLQIRQDVDIFSVNVPLCPSLKAGETKIKFCPILNNKWGSIYEATNDGKYEWRPNFDDVYRNGLKDLAHTDNKVLLANDISVTPLRASFATADPLVGEIDIYADNSVGNYEVFISYSKGEYIHDLVHSSFKKLGIFVNDNIKALQALTSKEERKVFHFGEYEDLDIDLLQSKPSQYFVSSYIFRKSLIRKHFLARTVAYYTAKKPDSILKSAVPITHQLELDFAEFLDDALDEAYELRQDIEEGNKIWILKPSMSDKGQGIRIFKSVEELQDIFNKFEENAEDADEEDVVGTDVMVSHLRHFIVQEYQTNPLLLDHYNRRKFHLRVYITCLGDLEVYVSRNILTLFAEKEFQSWSADKAEPGNLVSHLTNTCLQEGKQPLVAAFWDLEELSKENKDRIFSQVKDIARELFIAATAVDKINFRPLQNGLETYGVDFLVNEDLSVKLLEVNAYPDFKQTGSELKPLVGELFDDVAQLVSVKFFSSQTEKLHLKTLEQVL